VGEPTESGAARERFVHTKNLVDVGPEVHECLADRRREGPAQRINGYRRAGAMSCQCKEWRTNRPQSNKTHSESEACLFLKSGYDGRHAPTKGWRAQLAAAVYRYADRER
jgi:hypothetical protein